ncbi:hypothetical protein EXW94_20300 [Enterobacter sp. JMULE2]|uniref:hypothetical protein n=1 Tax=Enterobacter sp. JMULE2 TaxID=2518340 RepID=UPI0015753432|nr:hypothetical protein [Enterobacter sp. JMULE2]NTZ39997.1 hypothetical protein [Enterobacter sp. JMULE2]
MLRMYVYPDLVRITREINRALFNDITDLLSRHNIQPATPDFMDIGGGLGMAQWAFVSEAGAIEAGDLIADYFRSIPRNDLIARYCVSGCGPEWAITPHRSELNPCRRASARTGIKL